MIQARSTVARVLALAALVFTTSTCAKEAPPARWNVLLVTVDTLRADRVGACSAGSARGTTPWIDAHLAADGVSFTHATTPRAKTTPALASLMTGLYPHEHGVRDLMEPLALDVPTLAERLRAAGWRTGAIVGNYVLKQELSGLARGFEQWTEDLPDKLGVPPDDVPQRTARSLARGATRALGGSAPAEAGAGPASAFAKPGEPWFLWLHFMDPHGRYEPPAEFRTFHGPSEVISADAPPGDGVRRKRFVAQFNVPDEARLADGLIDAGRVKDLYDGEVSYVDTALKELFAALGPLENTLVVFTADHGEAFGEHEVWFEHGQDAYEETTRVPFVVRFPAAEHARPKGVRSDADLSLCDVAPTILEYLQVPPLGSASNGAVRGRSRLDTWLGAAHNDAGSVFSERVDRSAGSQYKAVRRGDWKLVRRYAQTVRTGSKDKELTPALRGEELFDLASDPREQTDLSSTPPAGAPLAQLRAELDRFTALDARFGALAAKPKPARTHAEEEEHQRILDNLGYGGGDEPGAEPAHPPPAPEPRPQTPPPKPQR